MAEAEPGVGGVGGERDERDAERDLAAADGCGSSAASTVLRVIGGRARDAASARRTNVRARLDGLTYSAAYGGRAMLARRALLPALVLVLVRRRRRAHPGHGQFVQVDIGRLRVRARRRRRLTAGEEVLWRWVGPDRQHTVTADPGQAETLRLRSRPRRPARRAAPAEQGFSHQFTTPGTYTYRCKVHDGMRGTIVVDAAAAARPAAASSTACARRRAPARR